MAEPKHDLGELRRRIEVSFSLGEIDALGAALGLPLGRERSVGQGAWRLVRAMAAQGRTEVLLERLRACRPLLEWPAPLDPSGVDGEAVAAAGVADEVAGDAAAAEGASGTEQGLAGPTVAPEPVARPAALPPSVPSDPDDGASAAARRPYLTVAALAGVLVAGVGIGLGIAWRSGGGADRPPDADAAVARAVADHQADAVGALARACAVEQVAPSTRRLLAEAFRRCQGAPPRPRRAVTIPDAPLLADDPPRPAARIGVADRPAPRRPTEPGTGDGCLDRCHRSHRACVAERCGAEPVGPAFAPWQRCLAACLAESSHCRLTCP